MSALPWHRMTDAERAIALAGCRSVLAAVAEQTVIDAEREIAAAEAERPRTPGRIAAAYAAHGRALNELLSYSDAGPVDEVAA